MKFRLIDEEKSHHSISRMCRVFAVTPAGYHAWKRRPPSARSIKDAQLKERVAFHFDASHCTYGAPRILDDLADEDILVSRKRVARLMRELGLAGRPVAFAGHEDGFLSEVGFTWGDGAEGGPSGLAIREHTSVILREIDSDTRFPIGREARIARGYRSLAALPLIDSTGDAFGALVFIAADANAFDVDELTLLEELAADLAFGIEARRTLARRLEAEDAVVRSNERLEALFIKLTEMIGRIVEVRDPYTSGHEERVAIIAVALAQQMGLPQNIIDSVRLAALVHDVGKMVVPTEILTKPGKVSEVEFSLIKEHAHAGYEILKGIPFDWPIAEFVLQHHERMDGSGYPAGLQGDEIHVESRILAVADVIEALIDRIAPPRGSKPQSPRSCRVTGCRPILAVAGDRRRVLPEMVSRAWVAPMPEPANGPHPTPRPTTSR